jgi:2-polyprenyl-3-methyl-5-hydroxy-6-metoxy-1,4-benzoquinol methylase
VSATCPSCGAGGARNLGVLPEAGTFAGRPCAAPLPGGALYECRTCALTYRFPVLSQAQYDVLYDNDSPDAWSESASRVDWTLVEDYLARHAAPGASVLDYGCYGGGLLERLGARYRLAGVEVNAKARETARTRTGAEVAASLEALEGRQFDVVVAVDVIEHFVDPARLLASLLGVTRKGGVLIISTGDADAPLWKLAGSRWWYCSYAEHVAFVSERWSRRWLARTSAPARMVLAQRFRYLRLGPARWMCQAMLTAAHLAAPHTYARMIARARRALGRGPDAGPPGAGVSKDHVLLVFSRTA